MTLKGGTAQACAACKHQRRKCTSECVLAPYFPSDQPKVFLNVHKLFGVSNIVKILKILDPTHKKIAMDSIIIQANYREKYPVHGCWEEICKLHYQIWLVEEELRAVYQHLHICKQQQAPSSMHDDVTSQLELCMAPCTTNINNSNIALFNHSTTPQQHQQQHTTTYNNVDAVSQQHSYSNSNSNSVDYNSLCYLDSKDDDTNNNIIPNLWEVDHDDEYDHYANNNSDDSVEIDMQTQLLVSSQQPLAIQQNIVDEMPPIFYSVDDRQSYIYSKEAYESSSEESLKDMRNCTEQHVSENELKNAAACFSLTSVN